MQLATAVVPSNSFSFLAQNIRDILEFDIYEKLNEQIEKNTSNRLDLW